MADTIDFYGGHLEIYFKSKDGIARSLRNIVFGQGGDKNSLQYVNFVERAKVKINILRFTEIEITFSPPFDQAIELIKSGVLGIGFSLGEVTGRSTPSDPELASKPKGSFAFNTVVVRFHHGGKKSSYFKGVLLAPDVNIGVDGISITVKATGMLFEKTKTSTKKPIQNQERLKIIQSMIGHEVNIKIAGGDAKAKEAMLKIENINANKSDFNIIKDLLDKSNCVIVDAGMASPDGKPTYEICSKDFMRKRQDLIMKFVLWGQINPQKGVYPIIGMNTTISNYMLGQSLGLNATVFDASSKKAGPASKSKVGAETVKKFTDSLPSGDRSMPGTGGTPGSKVSGKHAPMDRKEDGSMLETIYGKVVSALESAFQYQIETIGIADILPGRTVNISVPGVKFLSGPYDLYEVEHEMSDSGFETRLTLARTGGGGVLLDEGVEALQAKAESLAPAVKSTTQGVIQEGSDAFKKLKGFFK